MYSTNLRFSTFIPSFENIFILKTNNNQTSAPELHSSWNLGSLSPGTTRRSTPASVITTRLATPPLTLSLPMAKASAAGAERCRKRRTRRKFRKKETRSAFVGSLEMDFLRWGCIKNTLIHRCYHKNFVFLHDEKFLSLYNLHL